MKRLIGLLIITTILFSCANNPKQEHNSNNVELTKKSTSNTAGMKNTETVEQRSKSTQTSSFNDKVKIKLTAFIPEYSGLSATEVNLLSSRLNAAIANVGYGGEGGNPRYIIGPAISILSQELTSTAPTLYSISFEVNFLIADVIEETIFSSYTTDFKGVGRSPQKAFVNGFKNINLKNDEFYTFLKNAEIKIYEYYDDNCEKFISQADAEISDRNYEIAYTILKNIPTESGECFNVAQNKRKEVFISILTKQCNPILMEMKAEFGKMNDASASGFNPEAMALYKMIDPESSCFPEAEKIYQNYLNKIDPKAKRDWELKMKQFEHDLYYEQDSIKTMNEYQLKMKEFETKAEIEGNKQLLQKYQKDHYYNRQSWIRRVFHMGELDPFDGYNKDGI